MEDSWEFIGKERKSNFLYLIKQLAIKIGLDKDIVSGTIWSDTLLARDMHMIIEGQGLKVRKGQYVCRTNFFFNINKQSTYRKLTT